MTIQKRQSRNRKPSDKQPPALIAWYLAERAGKHFWTRIGAAWDHEDAKVMTLQLDFMPVGDGRIVLRKPAAVKD